MKRLICILLALLAVLSLAGCQNEKVPQSTVTVYYRAASVSYGSSDGVLSPYQLDATGHEDDPIHLLNAYLSMTPPSEYSRTFPSNTHLVSLNLDGLTAKVVLSNNFASLKGLNLSIACASLTRTVISLTGCHEVIISAEDAQLDGKNFITLSHDSYLLLDDIVDKD